MSTIEELSLEQIEEIEAGGREKGVYDDDVLDFVNAGRMGQTYPFSGKKAQSVKTGFTSAVERLTGEKSELDEETKAALKNVQIRVRNDAVYLIRRDLVKQAKQGK